MPHFPLDVVRRTPHVEIREVQMAVLVISGMKEFVEDRLVLFAEHLEVYDHQPLICQLLPLS